MQALKPVSQGSSKSHSVKTAKQAEQTEEDLNLLEDDALNPVLARRYRPPKTVQQLQGKDRKDIEEKFALKLRNKIENPDDCDDFDSDIEVGD